MIYWLHFILKFKFKIEEIKNEEIKISQLFLFFENPVRIDTHEQTPTIPSFKNLNMDMQMEIELWVFKHISVCISKLLFLSQLQTHVIKSVSL